MNTLITAIEIAIALGLAIFVHELGHFIFAKLAGVRVERFSIGFGPRLVGFTRGETEYKIGIIPLGGYVKMTGEQVSEKTDDPKAFNNQPARKRAAILVMGVVMNVIWGFILFVAAFTIGVQVVRPVIGAVKPGSSAWKVGLRSGDDILAVNGHDGDLTFRRVMLEAALTGNNQPVTLKVKKADTGEIRTVEVVPDVPGQGGLKTLAIYPASRVRLSKPTGEDTPAAKAGIPEGADIVAIDGQRILNIEDFLFSIRSSYDKPVTLTLRVGGEEFDKTVVPTKQYPYTLGLHSSNEITISKLADDMPAAEAGLEQGDRLVRIGGEEVTDFQQVVHILNAHIDQPIEVEIERPVKPEKTLAEKKPSEATEKPAPEHLLLTVTPMRPPGFLRAVLGSITSPLVIGSIDPDSPAARAGLEPGSRIIGVQFYKEPPKWQFWKDPWVDVTKQLEDWEDLAGLIDNVGQLASEEQTGIRLTVLTEDGETGTTEPVVPVKSSSYPIGIIGVGTQVRQQVLKRTDLVTAVRLGVEDSILWSRVIVATVWKLATRQLQGDAIAGPIGIVHVSAIVAEQGLGTFIHFFGIININLAIVNLLPLLPLDGGWLLLLLIEKFRKRPLKEKTLAALTSVGFALILALFLFLTFNDIRRLLG